MNRSSNVIWWATSLVGVIAASLWLGACSQAPHQPTVAEQRQAELAKNAEIQTLRQHLSAAFASSDLAERFPGLAVASDSAGTAVVRYHVRSWKVYPTLMSGFSDKLSEVEGPTVDGLLVSFSFCSVDEPEQVEFHSVIEAPPAVPKARLADDVRREPYWWSFTCGSKLPDRRIKMFVTCEYGFDSSPALREAVLSVIKRALNGEHLVELDP